MNKILKKAQFLFAMVLAAAGAVVTKAVHAAADSDLSAGLASTTLIFTDNKGSIISWVVGIFAVTIVVGLLIKALFFGKRQALGMLGGGRRRR